VPVSSQPLSHVYLSPHLDDAALSCGGLIHRQAQAGEPVLVVSLCAGFPPPGRLSPFAESLHARWRIAAGEAVSTRRAEDQAALQTLGAAAVHLDVPDCIYRPNPETGEALYASEESLWGPVHASEASRVEAAAAAVGEVLQRLPLRRFYAPLALGHHVDHQLARQVAERLGGVWAYYEDYPYADREANLSPNSKITGRETAGLVAVPAPISEADLAAKCRAVAAYASQISTFWGSASQIEPSLRAYAEHTGNRQLAERLWRPAPPAALPPFHPRADSGSAGAAGQG
jgi:LmbE family N-acetylglucosaminyl deacetylase